MKKTFNINISGYVFIIDDDAYELLKDYLDTLHKAFQATDDSAELLADMEQRIAELFSEQIAEGHGVISLAQVESVIARMGRPEELVDFTEETTSTSEGESIKVEKERIYDVPPPPPMGKPRRRLFRDPTNKMLGGVCSGLGAYVGMDPTWVRLIAVILAFASFSTLCLVYLILWIVIPEAQTPLQMMEMRGEAPTIDNIGRTVTDSFRNVRDGFNSFKEQAPARPGKAFADGLASFFGFVGRILLIIFIIVVGIIVFGLSIGFFGCILALISFITPLGGSWFGLPEIPSNEEYTTVILGLLCAIGYIIAIGIPLFFLLRFLLRSSGKQWTSLSKGWRISLITTWAIGFVMAGVFTGALIAHEQGRDYSLDKDEIRVVHDTVVVDSSAAGNSEEVVADTIKVEEANPAKTGK